MFTIPRKQKWVAAILILLAGLSGLILGYGSGYRFSLYLAQDQLQEYAHRISDTIQSYSDEARNTMKIVNASPLAYCSEEQVAALRQSLFRTQYLRDIGRIRNGKIGCSATMGRLKSPLQAPAPLYSVRDGAQVYGNMAPMHTGDKPSIGLQKGDAYIVYSDYVLAHVLTPPMHFTFTVLDHPSNRAGGLRGESPNIDRNLLTKEGSIYVNHVYYFTRCAYHYGSCVTTYIAKDELFSIYPLPAIAGATLGALVGSGFGILIALLYWKSRSMENQLRHAIKAEQLWLVYQPIVDINSRSIVEAEALLRWTDDDGFNVSPDVFVRLAEERGFINELTRYVVSRSLRDLGELLRTVPDFRLNLNITAWDLLDNTFPDYLQEMLHKAGVSATSIAIEITESSAVRGSKASQAIQKLRQQGHIVQIDDFGTGYSSLSCLKDLHVDVIKVDRSFTMAIGTESVTEGILPQILAIAEALRLQVIVEGIETEEQARYFEQFHPALPFLGQGWLYGRPITPDIAQEQWVNLFAALEHTR